MDLSEFLLARIAEDEECAHRLLAPYAWGWSSFHEASPDELEHIARHDPARVLADCAAVRAVVGLHRHEPKGPGPVLYDGSRDSNEGVFGCAICSRMDDDPGWHLTGGWCDTLLALAQPFAGHDDFKAEWRPAD